MIQQLTEICAKCKNLRPIQNKTHQLCAECVFEKNHGGKTRKEVYQERHNKKVQKEEDHKKKHPTEFVEDRDLLVKGLKQVFSIKKISNKRAARHKERDKIYAHIDKTREPVCEGCNRGTVALSHSHLLSEQDRPDLYANEDNIRLHCYGGYGSCHEKWERGIIDEVVSMHDFAENLSFIKEVDHHRYNAIVAKANFRGIKLPEV